MKRIMILTLALIVSNYGFSQTLTPPPADEQTVAPAIAPTPVAPAPKTDGGTIDGDSLIKKYLIESASGDTIKLPASCKEDEITYVNATAKAKADRDLTIAASNKKCDGLVDVATKAFLNKLQAAQVVETKKGNLEGALAIKAKVEKMNPKPEMADKVEEIKQEKITSNPIKAIIGKWTERGVNMEFKPNGKMEASNGTLGSWACKKDTIVYTWVTLTDQYSVIKLINNNEYTGELFVNTKLHSTFSGKRIITQ